MVETVRPVSLDELRHALWQEPRVTFIRSSIGLVALNSVIELMRDLGRPRNMYEVAVREDALAVDSREVYLTFQVHNEAIAIPENIDAIRALTGIERSPEASINRTDQSLRIVNGFLPRTVPESAEHAAMGKVLTAARREHMRTGFKGSEEPAAYNRA